VGVLALVVAVLATKTVLSVLVVFAVTVLSVLLVGVCLLDAEVARSVGVSVIRSRGLAFVGDDTGLAGAGAYTSGTRAVTDVHILEVEVVHTSFNFIEFALRKIISVHAGGEGHHNTSGGEADSNSKSGLGRHVE